MNNAVYIHIPFCKDICTYCDFCKFYYDNNLADKYLESLEKEIIKYYNGEIIKTIYIGGGTPSILNNNQIEKLMNIINIFNKNVEEFTFECNIESINEEKIRILSKYGVNRISIGIQTFNEKYLKYLNRKHTSEEVISKVNMIKKYIDNINIDLIYAIEGQTLYDLEKDIDKFLDLNINHISTYSLIIEPHTVLSNNNVEVIDDELDYEMYKLICNKLESNNYIHYETSNFAKTGYESKHNLVYWNNNYYYGFGLGASGYIDNIRYTNTKSINNYLNSKYRYIEEKLNINEIIENEFILGFRKIEGINISKMYKKYNLDIKKIDFIIKLINEKKLVIDNNNLKINSDYIYISNDILIEFLGVDYEKYI